MSGPGPRVLRFTAAERLLHWLMAVAFFVLLGSGLAMMQPALADLVARPVAKAWHLYAAVVLLGGTAGVFLSHAGRLVANLRELEVLTPDDVRWLRGAPRRIVGGGSAPPQGRFNAGQKLNTAFVLGLLAVSYITGTLMWLGERDTTFRFGGTFMVHDWTMWFLVLLVAGHLYMALVNPATRPALPGIVTGRVDREWARRHHRLWVDAMEGTTADGAQRPPGDAHDRIPVHEHSPPGDG
ncbi:MAG: cytochrome b/b6 domain-containing protein [Thermoleophilia bacterium]